jgi:hypothetical protein
MNMRVQGQLLGPGVQHRQHGDGAADVTRIAGEFDDRGGGGLHQHAVAITLIGPQHFAQFGGHGDGDMEIRHRQHLRLPVLEPFLDLRRVTLGTTAIATRVVGEHLGVALVATPDLATECRGAAVEDVFDGAPV